MAIFNSYVELPEANKKTVIYQYYKKNIDTNHENNHLNNHW